MKAAGLPVDMCGEFMWMYRDANGTEHYKHYNTRRYVHFTGQTADIIARQVIRDEILGAMDIRELYA